VNWTFLYVALIYFGAVLLWKRRSAEPRWPVAVLFYLLVLLFMFRPMTMSYVNVPADYAIRLFPWQPFFPETSTRNSEINDVILQMVPWANQVREDWRSFHFPLWNESAGGGYPLLANGQSGGLSILRLITLPMTLGDSFTAEAALKFLVAMFFSFLYMRRRGRSEEAAVITAISFGFCTFLVVWLHFPHASVACFLPALFFGIDLLLEGFSHRRLVFCSAVFAVLLLNGHPETAAHLVIGAALYVGWFLIASRAPRKLPRVLSIAAAGILGLIIALPLVLPLMEALPFSQRYEMLKEIPHSVPVTDARFLVNFFQVDFYGTVGAHNIWGPGIAEVLSGYAGILAFVAWFAVAFHVARTRAWKRNAVFIEGDESSGHLMSAGRLATFYVLASLFLTWIILGWPVLSDLFHKLPLFEIAANGRLRVVLCWFLAVLAGTLVDLARTRHGRPAAVFGLWAGVVALAIAFTWNQFPTSEALEHSVATTIPRILVLVAAALLLVDSPRVKRFAILALITLCVGDLWTFDLYWNPVLSKDRLYPTTPLLRFLERKQQDPEAFRPFRMAATSSTFFPNSAGMFGLEDIRSHDPMSYGKYLGALRAFTGYSSFDYFGMLKNFEHPFIDYLNVRYILTSPYEDYRSDRFTEIYSGLDGKIYENRDALPRFFAAKLVFNEFDDKKRLEAILKNQDWANSVYLKRIPSDLAKFVGHDLLAPRPENAPLAKVKVTQKRADEFLLDIDAPRWTLIIGSQPHWQGWKIFRNGRERLSMIEVNGAFMGFIVPPGKSTVRVYYFPLSFYVGLAISLVTILVLLTAPLFRRFFRRTTSLAT